MINHTGLKSNKCEDKFISAKEFLQHLEKDHDTLEKEEKKLSKLR